MKSQRWHWVEPRGQWQRVPADLETQPVSSHVTEETINPFKESEMPYKQPEFSGEVRSWLREGAKDLHNAIVPAFPSSQHGVDEQGTPLSPTSWGASQSLYGDVRGDAATQSDDAAGQGDSYQAMLDSYSRGAPQEEREDEDADER